MSSEPRKSKEKETKRNQPENAEAGAKPDAGEKQKVTKEFLEKTGRLEELEKKPAASPDAGRTGGPALNKMAAGVIVLVVVIGVTWLAMGTSRPPAPVAASAPAEEFSAERAMEHLKVIAAAPHPLGSAEHAKVQAYIVGELKKAQLEPQVQAAVGVTSRWYASAASVENIVARLPGSNQGGKALLLAAHYDSVPAAPGAGDDGAGVAAMLETLRALKAGPPLKNDVIFLFTDGEEAGLLGASAFMDEHPWAKEIGAALNFEGRGKNGAAMMFETSAGNSWLVDAFAKTPHPRGSSLAYEIYKRMPNDTDFTVFKKHGAQGLNFAFVDDWYAYHTAQDSPDRINPGSLQHHGESMLSLARQLGDADFPESAASNAVYFNVLGNMMLRYPAGIGVGLAIVVAALYAFVLWRELKQGRTIVLGVAWGAGIFVLSLAFSAFFGFVFVWKASFLHGWILPEGDIARSGMYMLSLATMTVACNTAMYSLWRNKLGAAGLALGGLFVWTLLALWTAFAVPGASYLFTWPLLGGLLAVAMFRSTGDEESAGLIEIVALIIGALPCVVLLAATVQQLFITLGLTQMGTQMIVLFLTLALWALISQIELMTRQQRWTLPAAAFGVCVVLFFVGMFTTRYSPEHPKAENIFYGHSADTRKAVWFNTAAKPDAWTKQFLTDKPEKDTLDDFFPGGAGAAFLKNNAPEASLAGADVLLGEEKKEGEERTLTLLVQSPRKGGWVTLYVTDTDVLEASVNGKSITLDPDARMRPVKGWRLRYSNLPEQGIEVMLKVRGTQPVKLHAVEGSLGLPAVMNITPRPDWIVPAQSGDATLVARAFTF